VICLPDVEFLPTPVSFATNIVQGRSYEFPGEDPIVDSVARRIVAQEDLAYFTLEPLDLGPTRGDARMVIPRLGQSGFKAVVQEVYQRRCAVTGHKIVPTLQAAHILPVAKGGQHRIDNGLLLRSDVHTMFDRGYIGIDTEFRLQVSPRLRDDFGNGDEFYSKEGAEITLPLKAIERPSQTFLTWHLQNTFR
jgi:putative restriction endonuclease